MLARLGVWTVGMSSGVELARARELGLLTGAIAVVANLACGLGSKAIEHEDVLETMAKASGNLERVIHHLVLETSSFQFDQ
jgi:purine nucleoside phosphorylase